MRGGGGGRRLPQACAAGGRGKEAGRRLPQAHAAGGKEAGGCSDRSYTLFDPPYQRTIRTSRTNSEIYTLGPLPQAWYSRRREGGGMRGEEAAAGLVQEAPARACASLCGGEGRLVLKLHFWSVESSTVVTSLVTL